MARGSGLRASRTKKRERQKEHHYQRPGELDSNATATQASEDRVDSGNFRRVEKALGDRNIESSLLKSLRHFNRITWSSLKRWCPSMLAVDPQPGMQLEQQ